jgi:aminoglycoside phosphotransferase family enzyme/predicted kinase
VRLHETHLSWVLLAGDFAYKVKKPVALGFADFSTRERRAAACADEIRLNRRLCPNLYLDVVDLVARDDTFAVGGPGQLVESAVRMRRLPDGGMLPALLARGSVDERLIARIARTLAQFHAAAATGPGVDEWGTAAAVRANWAENFAQSDRFVGRSLAPAILAVVRNYVGHYLDQHLALLNRRVAAGRVRDGHGDLHSGNICVEGRRLHLFDCIEFSPRYRCADVAAEVAFLAMDLDRHGRADLGATFADAYARMTGDEELPDLLDFYKCYRAWVRGKVLSLRLDQPGLSPGDAAAVRAEAAGYFDLAWSYAGGLPQPTLLLVVGASATGKTSLARALAGRLGLIHLSSDLVRKELAGHRPTDRRRDSFGKGLYSAARTRRTYAALRRRAAHWLDRGRSVVLDATFGQAAERAAIRRLAARRGVRLIVLHCQADDATIRARLAAREHDPLTASDARLELWPALRRAYTPPDEIPGVVAIDMTAPLDAALARALAAVGVPAVQSMVTDHPIATYAPTPSAIASVAPPA